MRSIDIRGVNAPPKFAKALADQEYGCESGLEDMTIPIKAVKRSGFGMNAEGIEDMRIYTLRCTIGGTI